ncbi:uncharacterized protein SEPMUDRAFT_112687 [Sphaerulina musiva SO2202]|uniref:Uncharacterized protein n=1 Tax=Sphaerulina musiva (strain SO2202) TaxID=692275 RepID=N1QK58_SPHMS|nr:uncharacterized protein SEPMUDRAFT_112687 [Sphaerulina musiva SO2202]EMF16647.1 hypothetical protein SEPMUDRAFT_112687 [Sphaerulina musiva SO2202]
MARRCAFVCADRRHSPAREFMSDNRHLPEVAKCPAVGRAAQIATERRVGAESGKWEWDCGNESERLSSPGRAPPNGQWRMHVMAWCISLTESGCIQQFAG